MLSYHTAHFVLGNPGPKKLNDRCTQFGSKKLAWGSHLRATAQLPSAFQGSSSVSLTPTPYGNNVMITMAAFLCPRTMTESVP